ncbi:retrovirus-related Pol polyprotein from transposon 297 [Trichonephila clavipes]|nr:retrovirus-related Pol polyprotein from transposon 297 [Trichonephila clavipes]
MWPLPITSKGNRYLITAICMSSKFPEAIPVSDISSVSVTDALLNIFSRMGFPREIQCDQGTSFTIGAVKPPSCALPFLQTEVFSFVLVRPFLPPASPCEGVFSDIDSL